MLTLMKMTLELLVMMTIPWLTRSDDYSVMRKSSTLEERNENLH